MRTAHAGDTSIALLADGVGSHQAGEVASNFVCEQLEHWFLSCAENAADSLDSQALHSAIVKTHELLYDSAQQVPAHRGMATTLALALQRGKKALVAWVGDSRIYHCRGGRLTQLSEDHSFVEEKVRQGVLTREEARSHPMANVITSCLGAREALPHLGIRTVELKEGDYLVLVSDGVSGVLETAQIVPLLPFGAEALVNAAIAADSRDNCSAIVIDVRLESPGPRRGWAFWGR